MAGPDFKLMAVRGAIKAIGIENIANMANEFINSSWQTAKENPLEPGEKEIACYLYECNGQTALATVAVKLNDNENIEITRYISAFSINEMIEKIIDKIQ